MKIMDDKSIRSALVTTPQPAAGWDEAALKALMDAGKLMAVCEFCSSSYPEGCGHYDLEDLRETPEGAWVCENCWDNSDDKPIWEDLPHVEALHREAPAPAEGVADMLPASTIAWSFIDYHQAPVELHTALTDLVCRARNDPRPDTAEARLREAHLDGCRDKLSALREAERQKMNAASDRAEIAASSGDMSEVSISSTESERHRQAFAALNAAISEFDKLYSVSAPPSGGDEAERNTKPVYITCAVCEKEARPDCEHSYCGFRGKPIEPTGYIALSAKNFEGGVEGHANPRMTSATTTRYPATEGERHMVAPARRTEEKSSTKTGPAGIKPGPSEPSPPADRREIVARLREMANTPIVDPTPVDAFGRFELTFGDLRAILAALDGGR